MIDHNVGVSISQVYEVKRIDSDYFAEGECFYDPEGIIEGSQGSNDP